MMPYGPDVPITILENCSHIYCSNCLKFHAKACIDDNKFPILCPDPQCKQQLHQSNVESVLENQEEIQKYRDRQLKFYGETHADLSWCPTPDCRYMFVYEEGGPSRFDCPVCTKSYCMNCRVEYHEGYTCEQWKIEQKAQQINSTFSEADKQFEDFVRGAKFKQCSKCKFWVEKNEGCDHMTCRCKYEFCYKCGGKYPHN